MDTGTPAASGDSTPARGALAILAAAGSLALPRALRRELQPA